VGPNCLNDIRATTIIIKFLENENHRSICENVDSDQRNVS